MKQPTISKKTGIIAGIVVLTLAGGTGTAMVNNSKAGADPTWPIVTEVDQQKDKLANHEARITNLEGNTQDLRNRTASGTTAPTGVAVPTVRNVTPSTISTPTDGTTATTPITETTPVVVSYREIPLNDDSSDCEYKYSDGSTYRFKYKTTNPQGAWITDGNGQNGHWQKSIELHGACNDSALGNPKANPQTPARDST